MYIKKMLIAILLIILFTQSCGKQTIFLKEQWPIEVDFLEINPNFQGDINRIIIYKNQLLINVSEYSNKERRYTSKCYFVKNNTLGDEFIIAPDYEIWDIAENNNKYYAILWNNEDVYLAEAEKNDSLIWTRVYTIENDVSTDYTLHVENNIICIISDNKFYTNMKSMRIKAYQLPNFEFPNIIIRPTILITKDNEIFMGSNLGEWGGSLYKITVNKNNNFEYQLLLEGNIQKIISTDDGRIFALISGICSSGIYEIKNDKVSCIYHHQYHWDSSRPVHLEYFKRIDPYNWNPQLQDNIITDIASYQSQLIILCSNNGIFKADQKNQLIKISKLPVSELEYNAIGSHVNSNPYIIDNSVEKILISGNEIILSYRLPLFFSNTFIKNTMIK